MTEADTATPATAGPAEPPPPPKKSRAKKIIIYVCVLTFVLSVLINIYLVAILAALSEADRMSQTALVPGQDDQVVAVYAISGLIDGSEASKFGMFYRHVRDNANIKAVVIRVDSSGGYVGASDQICDMVKGIRTELKRPVVVSFGGVAASGGYYVATQADAIYAEPTTITASIGVIMQFPVVADWLEEHKLKMVTIRSSQAQRYKAAINYFENPDPEILRERQKLLDFMHEKFVEVVKTGRGDKLKTKPVTVTFTDIDGKQVTGEQTYPLNGQILTSKEALTVGLVDEIGYIGAATAAAAKLAKLDKPKVVQYSKARGLLSRMLSVSEGELPIGVDTKLLERFLSPRPMMIWEGP